MVELPLITWFVLGAGVLSTGLAAAAGSAYAVWRCLWRRCPALVSSSTEPGQYVLVLPEGLPGCGWGGGAAYVAELWGDAGHRLCGVASGFMHGEGGPPRARFVAAGGGAATPLVAANEARAQLRLWWRPLAGQTTGVATGIN